MSIHGGVATGNLANLRIGDDVHGAAAARGSTREELAITLDVVVVTRHAGQIQGLQSTIIQTRVAETQEASVTTRKCSETSEPAQKGTLAAHKLLHTVTKRDYSNHGGAI
jgi:hypothetical protein